MHVRALVRLRNASVCIHIYLSGHATTYSSLFEGPDSALGWLIDRKAFSNAKKRYVEHGSYAYHRRDLFGAKPFGKKPGRKRTKTAHFERLVQKACRGIYRFKRPRQVAAIFGISPSFLRTVLNERAIEKGTKPVVRKKVRGP